ncbi:MULTISPECIES: ABC transporter substrate-binding protein [unclassified Variovorax]|uniref:ABC transporter substrate-binding protein n=1 Tax=unclassified Variovorax TaxID=663243 RepID=UPI0008B1D4E6|nr:MULTISPECIES: ABC transporter substrate-binding protein [unclassified Variovorax]SEJ49415.1 NitT/TauT family transport system substrate-binding protein [Variovorax sp. OK202]SFC51081.1 NitT/TauT family transport system substrate-binding protein [Variovorax sp. OK212]
MKSLLLRHLYRWASILLIATSAQAAMAQGKKVVLSQLFQSIQLLPVYVAIDGGFFEKEGLEVSKQTAGSANAALSALLSGTADFSLHGPEWSAIAAEKGAAVQVIASVVSRPSFWIAAAPEAKFESITDLKGQTVVTGMMPTTSTSMFLKLLKQNGLTPGSDVKVTQVQIGAEPGPLLAGQAKFAVLYQPGLDQVAARGMKVVYGFSSMADAYTVAAISTRPNVDPDTATRFVKGLQNALAFMQRDLPGTIAIAKQEFPSLEPTVVEAAVKRMVQERIYSTSVDISAQAFENSMATQVELGNLNAMPAYDKIVSRRYIRAALGEKP